MNKYSHYIEISANYESVVDMNSEDRNPGLWKAYIVQDDMKNTINAICKSMNWDDIDKRRSFWIHGTYGTGKSYATLVLKHLFEDEMDIIEPFLNRPSMVEYKTRFKNIRNKGKFLVVQNSGTSGIKSGTHLLIEMEVKITKKLKEKFGDSAFIGKHSLTSAAKDAINDQRINWGYIFEDAKYSLSEIYNDLAEFKMAVMDGDSDAILKVKSACDDAQRTFFAGSVEIFETWVKEIIEGNNLSETGIVFIWDEFTAFVQDNGDDNILQRLSEFCKSVDNNGKKKPNAPFFMFLIVHRDPTWVSSLGDATYERIMHRYHELEYHITESAAFDLIGDSIIPRPGLENEWNNVKEELLKSIFGYANEFDTPEQNANIYDRLKRLAPFHPMTVTMLSIVAEQFGASQRTLFRFMKDRDETSESVGFVNYIVNNEPDKWKWLTPDYLWDYFFTRASDVRSFNNEAKKVIQHFQNYIESISNNYTIHVFKAAMLLIAMQAGSSISSLYSRQSRSASKISATKKTLYKCFYGQLEKDTIDQYLEDLKSIGALSCNKFPNGEERLELPYIGNTDMFDVKLEETKKNNTRYNLFDENGDFSKAVENGIWDSTKASFNRVVVAACSKETKSLKKRLQDIINKLKSHPYKIGLFVVVISEDSEYASYQSEIKKIASENNDRLAIAMLQKPCTTDMIDDWHASIAHKALCNDSGNEGEAYMHAEEAGQLVSEWAMSAVEGKIFACYGNAQFTGIEGKRELVRQIEEHVLFKTFNAAPEKLITSKTAYRQFSETAVLNVLTKKTGNNNISGIISELIRIGAWDKNSLEELINLNSGNSKAISELASFMQKKIASGDKIQLSRLWAELQKPPFGYYNSLVTGCILGLIMREFINSRYNWFDGSNTHPTTDINLSKAINSMVCGRATEGYFSAGSAIWQNFKKYIQNLFDLSNDNCVSEEEARKYIKQKITAIGVPIWALKYLPANDVGGAAHKEASVKIIDLLCNFIYKDDENQEIVMGELLELFNGRGDLRNSLTKALSNKETMTSAFKQFMFFKASELGSLSETLNLSNDYILDSLKLYMQDYIYTWRESEVSEKLVNLVQEFKVVAIIKTEINPKLNRYSVIQEEFNNIFDNMKVPGTVIETLSFNWLPALKIMRQISNSKWSQIADKEAVAYTLEGNAKKAWEHLSEQKLLLKAVLRERDVMVSEDELQNVYSSLEERSYETTVSEFEMKLNSLLENIDYIKKSEIIKRLWKDKTSTVSVETWCNSANIPAAWVFEGEDLDAVSIIYDLQNGRIVKNEALSKAEAFLKSDDKLSVMNDPKYIKDRFLAYIGENYRAAFSADRQVLINRLKTNLNITANVYSWDSKILQIRAEFDSYLRNKYIDEAKQRVNTKMSDIELRVAVLNLLDKNPELYSYFLNKAEQS